jgi:hypothetical protein
VNTRIDVGVSTNTLRDFKPAERRLRTKIDLIAPPSVPSWLPGAHDQCALHRLGDPAFHGRDRGFHLVITPAH